MTVPSALLSFLRRASRWLLALAALGITGFATAAALMFFLVLPNIADHRDTVANLMSRALGQTVTLEAVSGAWQQARPEFRLQGVRIHDAQGQTALYLPELEAAFAWRSLVFLEPRFTRIELQGLTLDIRRAHDGHYYVGGVPVNPTDPNSRFSNWLLRQGQVHVTRATLTWQDEVRNAPPLILTGVDFTLSNVLRTHRFQLYAIPPADLAQPLMMEAKLSARDVDKPKTWNGTVDATVEGVSFSRLLTWLALPYQPHEGLGTLTMKFEVESGGLTGVNAGLDFRMIETRLGEGLPALHLDRLRGRAMWKRGPDGQRVAFENLRLTRPDSGLGKPFNVGLSWNGTSREITAQALSLSGWQSILPSLPMDAALRARLYALQPQGRLDDLRFRWVGVQPGMDNFSVMARFSGLGVMAVGNQPGLLNFAGRVDGDARAGTFEIDSRQLTVSFPVLFREPQFEFDTLRGRGGWRKTARGRQLSFDEVVFANPDMAGTAKGHYELIAGQPGVIDLNAFLTRTEGSAVYRYFPRKIGERTVNWVKRAIVTGHAEGARLTLKGDLSQFPFEHGNGVFRVDAQVRDGVIDYVPGWPRIDGIQARLLFQGKAMEVTASQARIYGATLAPVKAFIPDLIHHEEQLHIEGQANGPVQDFIRFTNTSPVGQHLRGFTDMLEGSGPMRLALTLHIPLRKAHDTTLAGRLSFLGDTLDRPGLPRIEQVRGDIDFTGSSLKAKNLSAQFLGGPLHVDAGTREGRVKIQARGNVMAVSMSTWLGAAWDKRLSGQAAWRGQIDLEPDGARTRIDSDLLGLALSLPAPLTKTTVQSLPLTVTSQSKNDGWLYDVQLGKTISSVWRTASAGDFDRGEIRFGGSAAMPDEKGMRLAGSGHGMDISGWMALLPKGDDKEGVPLSSIDLSFDAFDLLGRRYQEVHLKGRTRNGLLRTQVTGRELSGVLTYRPAGEQAARVSAQFKQLTIPERAPASDMADGINMKAEDFPALDMTVEDFRLQGRSMGRLEVVARGAPQGLVIDNLQLTHADSVFRMSGLWRDSGVGNTRADLSLSVLDAGRLLTRFGYVDTLKRGNAEIQGSATWEGSPADFSFDSLAGQLDFKAKSGQFLKVDPGAGKLLGVLSLQSLPRRLNFDFRDIFNEGYAFDDISATLRIARGVVYSDDFKMRGPAAKVNMSGLADLNQESVQLRVKVIPKLSEGVAVAGALIGGPLAGVGALAAQKLLRDPIEEATSKEYLVTGAWQSPDVTKLNKARGKTETPAFEP